MLTYNNRVHSFLRGLSPNGAELDENAVHVRTAHEKHYASVGKRKVRSDLLQGQMVRISLLPNKFRRGYKEQQTHEIFVIDHIDEKFKVPLYYLRDWGATEILKGGFYANELTAVSQTDFKIETIIERRGNKSLVKWVGYGNQHNSWVKNSEITRVFNRRPGLNP